jgi:hypothetical protein
VSEESLGIKESLGIESLGIEAGTATTSCELLNILCRRQASAPVIGVCISMAAMGGYGSAGRVGDIEPMKQRRRSVGT